MATANEPSVSVPPLPAATVKGFDITPPVEVASIAALPCPLAPKVTTLASARAHADVIITIKDGRVQFVRVNQTFLPEQLPRG